MDDNIQSRDGVPAGKRAMPRDLNAAVDWTYRRLITGVERPSARQESEIKAALRLTLRRAKELHLRKA